MPQPSSASRRSRTPISPLRRPIWLPVSGAKAYNVYRAQNSSGATGQLQLIQPIVGQPSTLTSSFSDAVPNTPTFPFVSSQNMLTYTYVVRSVSTDNVESADSTAVTAQDTVVPTATIPAGLAAAYTITFIEPEATATTLTNYALVLGAGATVPAVSSAVLNAGLTTVTGNLTITGIKDIAGNAMTGAARTF